jgi:hypothetical protein
MNDAPNEAGAAFLASPAAARDDEERDLPSLTPDDPTLPLSARPAAGRPEAGDPEPGQPEPAQAEVGQAEVGQPASARSHRRARPAGSRRPPAGGDRHSRPRGMRGMLITPWFAAGAGFVIAAALALNSPHTVLTYKPNTSTCSTCVPSKQSLATAKPGVVLQTPKSGPAARSDRRARPAVRAPQAPVGSAIGYRVVWQKNGSFAAVVTVPQAAADHGWSLRFEIPGHRILGVWGAQWAPAPGGYGGEVSSFATRSRPGSPGSAGSPGSPGSPGRGAPSVPPGAGRGGRPGQSGHSGPDQLRFLVSAQGTPVTPAGCVLNGASCHFG